MVKHCLVTTLVVVLGVVAFVVARAAGHARGHKSVRPSPSISRPSLHCGSEVVEAYVPQMQTAECGFINGRMPA